MFSRNTDLFFLFFSCYVKHLFWKVTSVAFQYGYICPWLYDEQGESVNLRLTQDKQDSFVRHTEISPQQLRPKHCSFPLSVFALGQSVRGFVIGYQGMMYSLACRETYVVL